MIFFMNCVGKDCGGRYAAAAPSPSALGRAPVGVRAGWAALWGRTPRGRSPSLSIALASAESEEIKHVVSCQLVKLSHDCSWLSVNKLM